MILNRDEVTKQIKDDMYDVYVAKIMASNASNYVKMIRIIDLAKQFPGMHKMDVFVDINSYLKFIEYAEKNGIKYSDTYFYIPG